MEIMRFVKNQVEDKTLLFYLCVFFTMGVTIVLIVHNALSSQMPPQGEDILWQILWIGSQMLLIYIWLYYASIVCKDLWRMKNAFNGKIYRKLYISFLRWLNQFSSKHSGKNRIFKAIYTVFWFFFFWASANFVACYLVPMNTLTQGGAVFYFLLGLV